MDDLDHSIHIAEYEWTSFYEECEECTLLQPSLAGLDNLSLSDSEDSASPVYPLYLLESQQGFAENSEISQSNDNRHSTPGEACTGFIKLSLQVNQSGTGQQSDNLTIKPEEDNIFLKNNTENSLVAQGDADTFLCYPGEDTLAKEVVQKETGVAQITEATNYSTAQQSECINVQFSDGTRDVTDSTDLEKGDGDVQRQSGACTQKSIQEPDPLTHDQAELNMNTPHTAESDVRDKESSVALRTEKERWFVTVNDSPLRQRLLGTSVKKKVRKKKPSRNSNHMCSNMQETSFKHGSELEINKTNESEGEEDTVYLTQLYQNSAVHPNAEILPESLHRGFISESSQICKTSLPFGEEENVSQKTEISNFPKAVTTEPWIESNKCEPYSPEISSEKLVNLPTSPVHDKSTLKPENATLLESVESDELEDGLEIFSAHSCDSESYFSAPEFKEEPPHVFKDSLTEEPPADIKQLPQRCTSSLTLPDCLFMLTETADVDNMQDTEMHSCDTQKVSSGTVSNNVAATSHSSLEEFSQQDHIPQGREDYVESAVTFPSAGQTADIMPEDNCTYDHDTNSTVSHMPLDTPELIEHESTAELMSSASSCLVSDQPGSPIPDLTVTPCTVANSPGTHAEASGPTRPVYAMSAFWDEMEKLTIKDILQLRMAKSPSPRETHDAQGSPRLHIDVKDNSSLVDNTDYVLPDGASMDTSDTADSDYFTQLDDSKPDRSSCEFSTFSDFEEEYWQFAGASRNASPDPHTNIQQSQRTNDSPFSMHDSQVESAMPEGTTAALEQYAGQCFDDHATHLFLSSEHACPKGMTKSKSMQNVQALNDEDPLKDVCLQSILDNAEKSLFYSNCQSLDENVALEVSDSIMLGMITPAPILSNKDILDENYRISFPEVFEYLFTDDEPHESGSITVYDPKNISVAPAYDYALSNYGTDMSFSSLHDSQCSEGKPIPIFSCSPRTVRDLTFPELDYLFFPQDMYTDCEEDDNSSPIRIVSRIHLQDKDSVSSTVKDNKDGWSSNLKRLLSIRKMRFPDKGSVWCRRSGAWVFPVERIPIKRANPVVTMLNQSRISSFTSQFFNELAVRQRILKSIQTTLSLSKQEGLFYTLKQSDMCLVCIAVASWVLRSSDPQAADTWKAALLANVSAVSAIRYLRQYVKKDPQPNEPSYTDSKEE